MGPSNFVKAFGYFFTFCFLVALLWWSCQGLWGTGSPSWMNYFLGVNLAFYLLGGLGLLRRRLYGYYALNIFLYALLISFPIGTLLAIRALRFMKREGVRSLFK